MLGVIAAAAGVSVGLLVWLALAWWRHLPARAGVLPVGVPLPLWWRLLAPAGSVFGHTLGRRFSGRARHRLEAQLRQAGWHHRLPANDVLGMQGAAALAAAALMGGLGVVSLGLEVQIALVVALAAAGIGQALPRLWLRDQARSRQRAIARALPFVLDMVTLCVEGGLNLQGALQQAAEKGAERAMREELQHTLADIRTGLPRAEALRQLAQRTGVPTVRLWVTAMIQAESLGMSLAPILRAQADQRRAERFLVAEKLAMQAPVKMLLPLVTCIFPCTFIVLGFPIVIKLIGVFG
ncbi:type II secretion system F family protein [Verticiella alkaliphila]|uniref:type II secretion system F family protein n=1 Tax=Verticiella alkaliphila TaxID=2779529 RepID=UPI00209AD4AC|nr:type II secretion system F family protein [Verticiella sp. GG226]